MRNKIANVMKALKKVNQLTAAVESSLKNSKCTEEVEHIVSKSYSQIVNMMIGIDTILLNLTIIKCDSTFSCKCMI